MRQEIRRIIAIDAHRRRTRRCPTAIHSLGSGQSFDIEPLSDGFIDVASGLRVRIDAAGNLLPAGQPRIEITLTGDIGFAGLDQGSGERFTGHAGGGSSVTIYGVDDEYYQYAVVNDRGGET